MMPRKLSRNGFTLLELIAVLALVVLLLGLLVVWIGKSRETAQRDFCTNRLKQLMLAVHNYHDTNRFFPAGATCYGRTGERSHRISAFPALVPFLESNPWYDEYTSRYADADPWDPAPNNIWSRLPMPAFRCPQDRAVVTETDVVQRTSYRVNLGDWPDRADQDDMPNPRGPFSLQRGVYKNFSSILDGTANTLAFSEAAVGVKGDAIRGGLALDVTGISGRGQRPEVDFAADACLKLKDGNSYTAGTTITPDFLGHRWGDADAVFTGFSAILPPNSPSCSAALTASEVDGESVAVAGGLAEADVTNLVSVTSYHAGGVNVAMLNGSVRFISESINSLSPCKTHGDPCVLRGPSPYGVWGMLGAINDSEDEPSP